MTDRTDGEFYGELDDSKDRGRGSCCTLWSFLLLFVTLFVLGVVLIFGLS
jgi:hypothetical protein